MEEFLIFIICLVIPSIVSTFLLVAFIHWATFTCEIAPNSAIQLNMPDAIYAFQQKKIKRHPIYWEFYTNQTEPEFEVKISFPTFVILIILHWINKWEGKKKINKEATNEFLKWLHEKGED